MNLFHHFISVSDDGPYTKGNKDSAASDGLTKRCSLAGRLSTLAVNVLHVPFQTFLLLFLKE